MRKHTHAVLALCVALSSAGPPARARDDDAPRPQAARPARGSAPSLTLYNQNFAVVRETIRLDVGTEPTAVAYDGVTGLLEPNSVILRDPTGKRRLQVREQSFLGDTASVARLLKKFEGKTLDFLSFNPATREYDVVTARLIRAGNSSGVSAFGYYFGNDTAYSGPVFGSGFATYSGADIVEVDGKVRFGLPGTPLFPREAVEGETLRPTLSWTLRSDRSGPLDAELAYLTRGFGWHATYNVVAPAETGDAVDLIGWATLANASGQTFENARIKLLAGDVVKLPPQGFGGGGIGGGFAAPPADVLAAPPGVTEKPFDEYHLYSLAAPTTLRNREIKQVELARAEGVKARRLYVYDGAKYDPNRDRDAGTERQYGTEQTNTKVWVMREFANTRENGLGIPLPAGRVRFYRRDDADGSLEFVGENRIGHTPRGENVRLYTGDAFDLVGERKQTDFKYDSARREYTVEETFEIRVRNRKESGPPVEVRVVEHLYRYANWYLSARSDTYEKRDASTIEFRVTVPPGGEKVVTYTVRYTPWPVDEKGARVTPPPP